MKAYPHPEKPAPARAREGSDCLLFEERTLYDIRSACRSRRNEVRRRIERASTDETRRKLEVRLRQIREFEDALTAAMEGDSSEVRIRLS